MGLHYGQTCPDINRQISKFKRDLEDRIADILYEINPLFKGQERDDYIKSYVNIIYDDFESAFESVRETNADLRQVAEAQIEELEQEILSLENTILELNEN